MSALADELLADLADLDDDQEEENEAFTSKNDENGELSDSDMMDQDEERTSQARGFIAEGAYDFA